MFLRGIAMNSKKYKGKVCKLCAKKYALTMYRHRQENYKKIYKDICKFCEEEKDV